MTPSPQEFILGTTRVRSDIMINRLTCVVFILQYALFSATMGSSPNWLPEREQGILLQIITLSCYITIASVPPLESMNGIFVADLVLYLLLLPLTLWNFWSHRWSGFLAWYYISIFCAVRVIGGGLGVSNSDSLVANILIGVGVSPLILTVDGLIHEARVHRNPRGNQVLGWTVITIVTGITAAGIALSITGALNIYKGHPKSNSLTNWEVGAALMVVSWVIEVGWAFFSILPFQRSRDAPRGRDGLLLLQASLAALIFIGIRIIYALVAVCSQRRVLSPVYGSTAVRVVLMFIPEALTALIIVLAGLQTRNRVFKA